MCCNKIPFNKTAKSVCCFSCNRFWTNILQSHALDAAYYNDLLEPLFSVTKAKAEDGEFKCAKDRDRETIKIILNIIQAWANSSQVLKFDKGPSLEQKEEFSANTFGGFVTNFTKQNSTFVGLVG